MRMESPWSTLTATLAKLYLTDLPIRWREVFTNCQMLPPRVVDLPSYPFQTTDFWTTYQPNCCDHTHSSSGHSGVILDERSLLKRQTQVPSWTNGRVVVYETPAATPARFIEGHMVAGNALCPASVYIELGLAAGKSSTSLDPGIFALSELESMKPFVYRYDSRQTLVTAAVAIDDGLGTFNVCSKCTRDGGGELHCRGWYRAEAIDEAALSALATTYNDVAPRIASLTSTSRDGVQGVRRKYSLGGRCTTPDHPNLHRAIRFFRGICYAAASFRSRSRLFRCSPNIRRQCPPGSWVSREHAGRSS